MSRSGRFILGVLLVFLSANFAISAAAENTITIANFNIQMFSPKKAAKPEIMDTLAKIISRFDIVAIQRIRDPNYEAIEKLEQATDALGIDYSYIIGPRLGRTSSKEQYAYLYKAGVVAPDGFYTYEDPTNTFHRAPLIAKFKVKDGTLGFVLITIHTDPKAAKEEINALPKVVEDAKEHFPGEKDFIILGDLNADCTYFEGDDMSSPLADPQYTWLIDNSVATNLASESCAHNRIIVTTAMAKEDYASAMGSGAFRFDEAFGLSPNQAKQVSNHYPVFSTFFTDRDTD